MSNITIHDPNGAIMCTVSQEMAHKLEDSGQIIRTKGNSGRFLSDEERRRARMVAARKAASARALADEIAGFDEWVAEQGPEVFV